MKNNQLICRFLGLFLSFISNFAHAGEFEIAATASYQQSSYGSNYSTTVRRYSASIGYHFFSLSELEVSVQDVLYKNRFGASENTTFHDQIYSVQWVQSLLPERFWIQPYFRAGLGQLNREASGSYSGGGSPPAIYDSVTAVGGVGLRVRLTKSFGLRAEGATYLVGGQVSTWRDNFGVSGGFSLFF